MPNVLSWHQVKNSVHAPLEGIDRIEVVEKAIDGAYFEVQFQTGPQVKTWKHITLTGGEISDYISEFWIARLELQDQTRGPIEFRVPAKDLGKSVIMMGRSKRPGEKHLYVIPDFPRAGVRLEMKWLSDGHVGG